MTTATVTQTRLADGIWHGRLVCDGLTPDAISVQHQGRALTGVALAATEVPGEWDLSFALPELSLLDGIQSLTIFASDQAIGQFTLLSDAGLSQDLRTEITLLRAELDMLKAAFRAHCRDSAE